jgi:hypothetical protein
MIFWLMILNLILRLQMNFRELKNDSTGVNAVNFFLARNSREKLVANFGKNICGRRMIGSEMIFLLFGGIYSEFFEIDAEPSRRNSLARAGCCAILIAQKSLNPAILREKGGKNARLKIGFTAHERFLKKPIAHTRVFAYIPLPVSPKRNGQHNLRDR